MAQIDLLKIKIDTNEVCIQCVPPSIRGVCKCKEPKYIPIPEYLHLDPTGQRSYLWKYAK